MERLLKGGGGPDTAFEERGTRRLSHLPRPAGRETKSQAKMARPQEFDGRYTPTWNVLRVNWIMTVERYLYNCHVEEEMYSSFAYSYLSDKCQAWFDNCFLVNPNPPWDEAAAALKQRYLPLDHTDRLLKQFDRISQYGTIREYVDAFQVMVSALQLASIMKTEAELIRRFTDGLKNREDRLHLLMRGCSTITDCYQVMLLVEGARASTSSFPRDSAWRDKRRNKKRFKKLLQLEQEEMEEEAGVRRLNRLQGKEKDKALEEGRCLECGKEGHWWRVCPNLRPKSHRRMKKDSKTRGTQRKKFKKMEKGSLEEEEEDSDPSSTSSEGTSTEDSSPNEEPDPSKGEESGR